METRLDVLYLKRKEIILTNKITEYIHQFQLDTVIKINTITVKRNIELGIDEYLITYRLLD